MATLHCLGKRLKVLLPTFQNDFAHVLLEMFLFALASACDVVVVVNASLFYRKTVVTATRISGHF
jgi:hypothetical protein